MINGREKIVVVEADAASRDLLVAAIQSAGYDVLAFASAREGLEAARQPGTDVLVLDAAVVDAGAPSAHEIVATIRGSAATEGVRVIVLTGPGASDRAAGLDLGADDSISRPWDSAELLARVRAQLRVRRADQQLLDKMHLAEEGQQIAHTAFDALAITEKMSSDAVSLNRRLKMGLAGVFAIALVMAGTYFLFARSAQKDLRSTTTTIARLERGFVHQQDLIAEARRLRGAQGAGGTAPGDRDELQKQAADLQAKMAGAGSDAAAEFRKELYDTNSRLKRIEQEGDSAQN